MPSNHVPPPGTDALFDAAPTTDRQLYGRDELVAEVMAWLDHSKPAAEAWIDADGHAHVERALVDARGW